MKRIHRIVNEFKDFAFKGNMLDLAIGVIIGSAFNIIVKSMVDNILMPIITVFRGKVDFSDWVIPPAAGIFTYFPHLKIGSFLSDLINFLITAFFIFFIVKMVNRLKKEEAKPDEAAPTLSEKTLLEIRDLLLEQKRQKEDAE